MAAHTFLIRRPGRRLGAPMPPPPPLRPQTAAERRVDALVHALGAALVLPAVAVLLLLAAREGGGREIVAAFAYAVGAVATFGMSAVYNVFHRHRRREWLRVLDHAAIFLMIAGTYTPFMLVSLKGPWGSSLLAFVWAVALIGIAVKVLHPRRWERAAVAAYLALGWSALPAVQPLLHALAPATFGWLVAGGVLYSAGVAFHLWDRLRFQNALWHGFVLAGAACHYVAVLQVLT